MGRIANGCSKAVEGGGGSRPVIRIFVRLRWGTGRLVGANEYPLAIFRGQKNNPTE